MHFQYLAITSQPVFDFYLRHCGKMYKWPISQLSLCLTRDMPTPELVNLVSADDSV